MAEAKTIIGINSMGKTFYVNEALRAKVLGLKSTPTSGSGLSKHLKYGHSNECTDRINSQIKANPFYKYGKESANGSAIKPGTGAVAQFIFFGDNYKAAKNSR
ncbi:MAG: hypothetical protein V1822_01735 [Candidatus Micrarchaeota archaeon]